MRGREHPRVVAVGWTVVLVVALVPTVLAVLGDSWVVLGALTAQLVLALAGLLLWFDPEHRRHGVLLMCASATGGLTNLNSLAFEFGYWTQLGWVLQWIPACFLLPVLLEYPSSRPGEGHGRDVRWLVLLTWVWALGLRLVTALAWDPAFVDYAGPVEWFAVYPSLVIARSAEYVALALLGVIAVWFTVLSVRRWREARGPMRGTVRLVSAAGILLALGLVLRNLSPYALRLEVLTSEQGMVVDLIHNVLLAVAPAALLVVAVRAATRRGVVMEHLLGAAGDPEAVEAVLRQELHDPSLRLTFTPADDPTMVTEVPATPTAVPGRIIRVLEAGDGAHAVVDADAQVLLDPAGLRAVLAATAVVLANTRLTAERAAHLAELESSRARIVEAGEAHRRQLERDLHDGAQQHLLTVATTISRARLAADAAQVGSTLDEARSQLAVAMEELRRLARGIHPAALSQAGLVAALEALAANVGDVELEVGPGLLAGRRLAPAVESTAYFAIAESVTNARKHAAGPVRVHVDSDGSTLHALVSDEGPGGALIGATGGLRGLVDRATALGGELVVSSPGGGGTLVRLELPLGAEGR
jgi:signal transduction histidine kinase